MNICHEVLTKDAAYQIANLDGKFSSNPNKYAQKNCFTYYIAVNTWYHQVADCDEWAASALLDFIKRSGLLQIIKDCDLDATRLVKGLDVLTDVGKLLLQVSTGSGKKYFGLNPDKNYGRDDLATALQLLRYLKRFSPLENDWVVTEGYAKFLQNENRTKMRQRGEYPIWLVKAVKDEIETVINWSSLIREIKAISPYSLTVPTGATYEGFHTPKEKVCALFAQRPEWAYAPFGLPYVIPYYDPSTDDNTARVMAVPKSYKAARIIAMEPVVRQSYAQKVMSVMIPYLPEWLDITDQARNQNLAQEGSRYDTLATLDATNASDLISKTLFRQVFPSEFVELADPLLSDYTILNGKVRPMQMMSTAGNALTFVLETLVYYGIAAAASAYYTTFTGDTNVLCSVYGDDVIISSKVASTAIDFYSMLGLKINEDKSYISGPYRESCGEEYYNGINVSSTYYPRFPVIGTFTSKSIQLGVRMYRDTYRGKIDDSTTMLVDLQKRLFGVSYNASLFLWEVVKEAHPKITSSRVGTICNDLWAAVEIAQPYNTTVCRERGTEVSPSVVSLCETQKHSYASIQYTSNNIKLDESEQRCFDIYKYQHFLQTGPSYSDPLLELLGVSDPPMTLATFVGSGRLVWRYQF